MKRIFLYFVLSICFAYNSSGAERFWVGGTGNWNDKDHWSEKSGGKSGASVPTLDDNVFFDKGSFRKDNETVIIDGAAQCRNLTWKKISFTSVLSGEKNTTLSISGSLAFTSAIKNRFHGKMIFNSLESNNTIYSESQIIQSDIFFDGKNGQWKFLDGLSVNGDVYIIKGVLNGNNQTINCRSIVRIPNPSRGLMTDFSSIDAKEGWKFAEMTSASGDTENNFIYEFASKKLTDEIIPLSTTTVTCATLTLVIDGTNPKCFGSSDGAVSVVASGGTLPYTYSWNIGAYTTPTVTGITANTYFIEVWDNTGFNYCSGTVGIINPAILGANITPPTPVTSCFGLCDGSATASGSGGTPPYTYSWNSAPIQTTALVTGLCVGNYTVTVTDNNACVRARSVSIGQPAVLAANGSSNNIDCFGNCNGIASASPTGGNPPYTYSWSPGGATTATISNLCIGTFTCTVTDTKTCVATYVTTITEPPILTTTVSGTNLICNGVCTGSVTATASGGVLPYTYSWSPGGYTTSSVTGLCAGTYSFTVTDGNACTKTATVTLTQPGAITATPTGTNINCFSTCTGTVNANAAGGVLPYTYLWSPGGCSTPSCSNLCAGTYTVNVNDVNGCATSGTITLTEAPLLTVTVSNTNASCSGFCNGTASAAAGGGTGPYTYLWSPGGATTSAIAGLCVGTYTITATDSKGCTGTSSVTITAPVLLNPNLSSIAASCFGVCDGSVSSVPTGGTSPFTYSWSNGCTTSACSALCAGNYTLVLTDANGCIATNTVTVLQPAVFSVSISSAIPNPLNCNGDCNGTASTSVTGGTPIYTYLWSTGAITPSVTGLCAGTYSVNVRDANGCPASTSVTFLQPTTMTVTVASSDPSCNGYCDGSISAIAGGGTPGYTYSWLPGGQTTSLVSSQCAGTYSVTVSDNNGCSNTQTVTLTSPSPLAANGVISNNVSCSGVCDGSAVSNPTGGVLPYTFLWSGGQTTNTATGLCAGSYTITVTDASGCSDVNIINVIQPAVLSSNISSTTSSCTLCTGSATVSAAGGTSPYTFLWSPGGQTTASAINLCIGTYTVNVTDANGCTNSVPATIDPVVTITVTASGASVNCAGSCDGIATANASGGNTPYTYQWTTAPIQVTQSVTGLCAGSYTVTVADSNGCISSDSIQFLNPPALTATMSSASASCGLCNGTATAAPVGGTGAYTYSWSGFPVQTTVTATGLCSGNYSVTITDANNCAITNTVAVGNIPAISHNPSITLAACGANDGAICVSPTGGVPGYTYVWAPGLQTTSCITGLAPGIYTVTISDVSGCSTPFAIGVGNVAGPNVSILSSVNPVCNANCDGSISVSASGGTLPYTFSWSPGGQTTTAVSALCAGTYIIRVIDAVPCTTFASVTLTDPPQFNANPVITNVTCNGGNNGSICLFPSGGISPYTFTWSGGQTTSCVTGLSAGTYTVIFADATGCDDTLSIPVAQPLLLNLSIASTNVTCNGNNDGTATATVTGGYPLYTYAWSTGAPISSIAGLAPGTYSLMVTDNNGCTATASVTITQPVVLTTTLSSTNISCNLLCDGTASIYAAGGTGAYTYSWVPGAQTTSAITGLCPGNYVGTVTDLKGCSSSQSVSITQPAALSATITSVNPACFGSCNGTSSVNASGGTGVYTYLWNPGGQTTSAVTGLCAGSYTLDITDANGCNNVQFISITSPSVLQTNITNTSASCASACDGTATSSPVGGTGVYSYLWSNGQTSATATGLCAGTYTLTLSDANGCFVTQTTTIISPAALTVSWSATQSACLTCNGSITASVSGGTGAYSYTWVSGQTTATITGLCPGLYIVTATDANGCTDSDTIPVSDISGPSLFTSGTNITCYGACNGNATVVATGAGPSWTYSWSPTAQTTATATGLCPAQYFIGVADTIGCITFDTITIIQPAQIVPGSVITNATCSGLCDGGITLNSSGGVGAHTYLWLPGGQTTSAISAQCVGNYSITITDANNCSVTTTISIGQNTLLTSTVTSTNNLCNASCTGTASILVAGGTTGYNYVWSNGQTAATATGLCAGTFTITVTDAVGCIRIDSAIIIQPAALAPNITAINPLCAASCNGSVSSAPAGGTAPYTYLWNPGGFSTTSVTGLCAGDYILTLTDANNCTSTTTITLTDPPLISSTAVVINPSCSTTNDGSIDISPIGGTGAYTFSWSNSATTEDITGISAGIYSVTITDANGCQYTDSVFVTASIFVIANAGNDTAFCSGGDSLCSYSINNTSLVWYSIPSWTKIDTTPCIHVSPPAGINYFALIALNGMCSDTDTVSITVHPAPAVDAGTNVTMLPSESTILNGTGNGTYFWSPLTGLSNTTIANPTAHPTVTTTYTLLVTDTNGCVGKDTVRISIVTLVIPYDGISPNGDGKNDVWVIPSIEQFPDALVEVYNRWGKLIFSSVGYKQPWDGRYKNKNLPVGTYYYVINLNSDLQKDPLTGPITIVR